MPVPFSCLSILRTAAALAPDLLPAGTYSDLENVSKTQVRLWLMVRRWEVEAPVSDLSRFLVALGVSVVPPLSFMFPLL